MTAGNTQDSSSTPGAEPPGNGAGSRFVRRVRATRSVTRISLAIVFIAAAALVFGLNRSTLVRDSPHWKFWLQVTTSNWSPDQPKKEELTDEQRKAGVEEKDYIGNAEYVAGTVLALVVNLGSFVLIFGTIYEVWNAERKKLMETSIAYQFRDINIQQAVYWFILNNFATNLKDKEFENERAQIVGQIRDLFNKANQELPEDIRTAFGEAGEKYLSEHKDDLIRVKTETNVPAAHP